MQQTQEFVSDAQAELSAQAQTAVAPKQIRQYAKLEIGIYKERIIFATKIRDDIKQNLVEANQQLKDFRQNLYEAEMQHAPIEVLPPVTGPSPKSRKKAGSAKTVKVSSATALKILDALVAAGLVDPDNLP